MPSQQDAHYWAEMGAEANDSEEDDTSVASGSGGSSDDDEEDDPNNVSGSVPMWPQSYRQSMDIYSALQSPSISLFSPGLHHRLSASQLSLPRVGSVLVSGTPPLRIPLLQGSKKDSEEFALPYTDPVRKLEDQFVKTDSAIYVADDGKVVLGSSFVQGLFNGVNVLAGVGVLTTPFALMQAGWIGVFYLFSLSLICFYTGILLRRCLESGPGLATYPDIGQAAFGRIGRIIISIILYTELYACCVEFLILEGDNLSALFPAAHLSIGGFHIDGKTLFSLTTALLVLPTVWLRDLSLLSYVSAGGVIASIVVACSVLWVGAVDGVGFHETTAFFNLSGLPVSIGLYGFCYSGHAVFPNIYSSLRNRNDYNKVLAVSFTLCTLLYAGMAVMGLTMFGAATASQITLNLPKQFLASKIAVWTTVVNPFTKFALTMMPVALSLEELLPVGPESAKHRSASILIRTALVMSTIGVAVLVPFFGFVMAFIGSALSMTVSLILPCACYLAIFGKKVSLLQASLCVTVIIIGFVCLILGTYSSVSGIIASYHNIL
jgi:vesicular inhibitory amino acid transporter